LLGESLRVSDVLARYGGEEFALLLPATDTEQAREIAERLRARIANQPLVLADGLEWPVTVSVGCATLANGNDRGIESAAAWLLRSADSALYAAKAGGRNRAASAALQDA
jgi:diguanylate cyclase (GGDEF)-like protein